MVVSPGRRHTPVIKGVEDTMDWPVLDVSRSHGQTRAASNLAIPIVTDFLRGCVSGRTIGTSPNSPNKQAASGSEESDVAKQEHNTTNRRRTRHSIGSSTDHTTTGVSVCVSARPFNAVVSDMAQWACAGLHTCGGERMTRASRLPCLN